jgi:L-lactate dehydrogenase complex protein LldG
MSARARDRILLRLNQATGRSALPEPDIAAYYATRRRDEDPAARIARFKAAMTASHGEVHDTDDASWPELLRRLIAVKGLRSLLVGAGANVAARLRAVAAAPEMRVYDKPVETWRDELFTNVDAALTGARSAIADTGSLIAWPDQHEPRLMSLVPPVHFVLLDAANIHTDLHAAIMAEQWSVGLPTNTLLISGPSKTADIQQTLAYGAHGPRELIVLLRHARGAGA